MRVELKASVLVIIAEDADDHAALGAWTGKGDQHVFAAQTTASAIVLKDLGRRDEATREPINVISTSRDPDVRLISNFAETPFDLDGREYASVEGFWQGLKFPDDADRERIARLSGHAARRAGQEAPRATSLLYRDALIRVGCWEHWALMRAACEAKFSQHEAAQEALLSTGERPLVHRLRRDSRSIPGAIMAEIWMAIRTEIRQAI